MEEIKISKILRRMLRKHWKILKIFLRMILDIKYKLMETEIVIMLLLVLEVKKEKKRI